MSSNQSPMFGVSEPISTAQPTVKELESTKKLMETLHDFKCFEPRQETVMRVEVLRKLNHLLKTWVKKITEQKCGVGAVPNPGGQVVPFGSFRLGVHNSGSDIDTLCVVPSQITRDDFFRSFKDLLSDDPNVTELNAVETAFVPLMTLKFTGIEVDLLFASLDLKEVPDKLDLSDDKLLRNLDEKSVRSLNGVRVVETLMKSVPRPQEFVDTLRAIKLWAKTHGIYSNAMGFFGGITWAILVARVCQLYPNACPAKLVEKVFYVFATWNWRIPVILSALDYTRNDMPSLRRLVWDPKYNRSDREHVMPILTPAFPQQNTTHNVTKSSAAVIQSEMKEALTMCTKINGGELEWKCLFEGINFFSRYKHFVTLVMAAPNEKEELAFTGFLESRVRLLVQNLESNPCINLAHNNPQMFKPTKNAKFDVKPENKLQSVWFVGLELAEHAKNLDLTKMVQHFKTTVEKQSRSMETSVQLDMFHVKRKDLVTVIPASDLRRGTLWKPSTTPAERSEKKDRKRPCERQTGEPKRVKHQ